MRIPFTAAAVSALLGLLLASSLAQVGATASEVKVTVIDQSGARIAGSELVFKSDSRTIVSHTGNDGAVTITLPSGQYAVTASARGFLKNNLPDFPVAALAPAELKVVLKVGPSIVCGPCPGGDETPTITSDLPNVIEDEPSPRPPVQPATKTRKSRSLQCLYLWKCSTS